MDIDLLKNFIAIQTIAHDGQSNKKGIEFISLILKPLGFEVSTEGKSPYQQPVIIAKHINPSSEKKVVLYGHYDVEKIKEWEVWDTLPFELVEKNHRLYGRGIADNKGILLTRILAIKELYDSGETLPNILWIIQGEEEVGGQTPFEVIPKHFKSFQSKIYLEETGIYKRDIPVIFHLTKTEHKPNIISSLNESIYSGNAILENRSLNKFTECPFLKNIPDDSYYIGFGPNDAQCNIHKANESLDLKKLKDHVEVFKKFIRWINEVPI